MPCPYQTSYYLRERRQYATRIITNPNPAAAVRMMAMVNDEGDEAESTGTANVAKGSGVRGAAVTFTKVGSWVAIPSGVIGTEVGLGVGVAVASEGGLTGSPTMLNSTNTGVKGMGCGSVPTRPLS